MLEDPVCGMTIDPKATATTLEFNDKTYHFCSQQCMDKFKQAPQRYLQPDHRDTSKPER
jgi:Cu+-exporting ATPase